MSVDPAPSESISSPETECAGAVNGFHANGSGGADGESLDSLSEQLDSASLDAAELELEPALPELSITSRRDIHNIKLLSLLEWCIVCRLDGDALKTSIIPAR